ncbi:MAG: hypothetical protein J0J14_10905, partial [Hyphomicrobium sp.]|nr:hypothetical protein [Hyphomicrobium sp.]
LARAGTVELHGASEMLHQHQVKRYVSGNPVIAVCFACDPAGVRDLGFSEQMSIALEGDKVRA